jgi:hypothetical protein
MTAEKYPPPLIRSWNCLETAEACCKFEEHQVNEVGGCHDKVGL